MNSSRELEQKEIHTVTSETTHLTDSDGHRWLFQAADEGHVDTAKRLLRAGADPYFDDNDAAQSALDITARNGNEGMIMMFADNGVDLSSVSQSMLAMRNQFPMVATLVKCGAPLNKNVIEFSDNPEETQSLLDEAVGIHRISRRVEEIKGEPVSMREQAIIQLKNNVRMQTDHYRAQAMVDCFEQLDRRAQQLLKTEEKHTFNSKKSKLLKTDLHACVDRVYQAYANQMKECSVTYLMDEVLKVTNKHTVSGFCFFGPGKECRGFAEAIEAQDHMRGWGIVGR